MSKGQQAVVRWLCVKQGVSDKKRRRTGILSSPPSSDTTYLSTWRPSRKANTTLSMLRPACTSLVTGSRPAVPYWFRKPRIAEIGQRPSCVLLPIVSLSQARFLCIRQADQPFMNHSGISDVLLTRRPTIFTWKFTSSKNSPPLSRNTSRGPSFRGKAKRLTFQT